MKDCLGLRKKCRLGFTLVEILIVVVAIALVTALLVTLVVSKYQESRFRSAANTLVSHMTELIGAQDRYYTLNSEYGSREEILKAGLIKEWPRPDLILQDEQCIIDNDVVYDYSYVTTNLSSGSRQDVLVALPCVKESVAVAVDQLIWSGMVDHDNLNAVVKSKPRVSGEGSGTSTPVGGGGYMNGSEDINTGNNYWTYSWSACSVEGTRVGTPKCFDPDQGGLVGDDFCATQKPSANSESCS